jgi:AtzE family amidohydrolase
MIFERMTAVEIADAVRAGEASAVEVTEAALLRARSTGRALNCYTAVLERRALDDAARVDEARRAGKPLGRLAGVPVAVKNLFDVAGEVTLAGSIINRRNPPASRDATALKRLRDEGAILVGMLGMDEYAYGFTNENTHYGPVLNPHDTSRTAGGSSGGSGAAVSSGCVPVSLGTDTNGSVRVPAALCGIFGLKPTYGRVSRAGSAPFVPSLDHVGFLTRSVRDASILFDLAHGYDPADPISSQRPAERTEASLEDGLAGLRIGVAAGYFAEELEPAAREATRVVAQALGASSAVELPGTMAARHAAMIISAVEGSALHLEDLRRRPSHFDPMTRDRFLAGAMMPGEAYVRAQALRHAYREAARGVFGQVDILVAPATPMAAPRIGQDSIEIDGRSFPSRPHLGRFTQPLALLGLPVMVVPVWTGELPLGVQLIGAPYGEAALLRAARFLEARNVVGIRHPRPTLHRS